MESLGTVLCAKRNQGPVHNVVNNINDDDYDGNYYDGVARQFS